MRLLAIAIAFTMLQLGQTFAAEPTTRPAVLVELFTSEGCSSCPPADVLLAKIAKPEAIEGVEIVPLALHVDYWDDLGWKDAYSSKDFTQRQRDYAAAKGSGRIYTPQMIVDGASEFVGSDARKARAAIIEAGKSAKGTIELRLSSKDDTVRCEVAVTSVNETADVYLAITEDDLRSDVARGENAGRQLTHVGVARSLQTIGTFKAGEKFTCSVDLKLDPAWRREKLKVIAFAQQSGFGPIFAVRSVHP
jgi:hypothetical protein